MDEHARIVEEFSSIPNMNEWPEVQAAFSRAAGGNPRHWLLPLRACQSVGGDPGRAIPAAVALACSHIGIVLVDDMLDADPRGEHLRVGAPAAANMACALQAAALTFIDRCEMSCESKLAAMTGVSEMSLATCLGQYWDVGAQEPDERIYWSITQTKSSPFFGAAFHLGALSGGVSVATAARLKELGCLYGEMIQIHDDLNDAMEVPASPDWTGGRSPLPILFARSVDHPARARFEELREAAGSDPLALGEAQGILIECGALSYCIDQLLSRYETVRGTLSTAAIQRPSVLIALFEEIVSPVWKLFQAAGESPFE